VHYVAVSLQNMDRKRTMSSGNHHRRSEGPAYCILQDIMKSTKVTANGATLNAETFGEPGNPPVAPIQRCNERCCAAYPVIQRGLLRVSELIVSPGSRIADRRKTITYTS
jgi:hypothetical protein